MIGNDICIDLIDGYNGEEIKHDYGDRIASTLVSTLGRKGYRLGVGKNKHTICFEDEKDAQDVLNKLERMGEFEPIVDKINEHV